MYKYLDIIHEKMGIRKLFCTDILKDHIVFGTLNTQLTTDKENSPNPPVSDD